MPMYIEEEVKVQRRTELAEGYTVRDKHRDSPLTAWSFLGLSSPLPTLIVTVFRSPTG